MKIPLQPRLSKPDDFQYSMWVFMWDKIKPMPKKAKKLSALSVVKIKENGSHAVGGVNGLHLRIVNDSRAWVLRVVVGQRFDENGKQQLHRRDIGLGSYPEVSLAEARAKAHEMKAQIRNAKFEMRNAKCE